MEDKPPILRNIKQKLIACNAEIEVVGEAANGRDAVPMLLEQQPDIVFTDIRMPLMDGLALIEAVQGQLPDTQFVILSSYDEFEYARTALRLGVSEYLLKPMSADELAKVLDRLVPEARRRRRRAAERYLAALLRGGAAARMPGLFQSAGYRLLLVCLGPYPLANVSAYSQQSWTEQDVYALMSHDPQAICAPTADGNIFAVLAADGGDPSVARRMLEAAEARQAADAPFVTVAEGSPHATPEACTAGYAALRTALRLGQRLGQNTLTHAGIQPEALSSGDRALCQSLSAAGRDGRREAFFAELETALCTWRRESATQHRIQQALRRLLKGMRRDAPEEDQPDEQMEIDELLSLCADHEELRDGLLSLLNVLGRNTSDAEAQQSVLDAIESVEAQIRVNYAQPLSVRELACAMGYAPAYFSRQYKKHRGVSPQKYLTSVRMNRACELLRAHPELKLRQVSEMVGYANPLYFSRIFKATMGCSPSEYKG